MSVIIFLGVSICGIGGQGKSRLAGKVCLELREQGWRICKVDLRFGHV